MISKTATRMDMRNTDQATRTIVTVMSMTEKNVSSIWRNCNEYGSEYKLNRGYFSVDFNTTSTPPQMLTKVTREFALRNVAFR
jgi:hypothetical protein